jgi:hypothetical protein
MAPKAYPPSPNVCVLTRLTCEVIWHAKQFFPSREILSQLFLGLHQQIID